MAQVCTSLRSRAGEVYEIHEVSLVTVTGDETVIAAPGEGYRFVLMGYFFCSSANVVLSVKSASTVKLFLPIYVNSSQTTDSAYGLVELGENEGLVLNTSGAASVGGWVRVIREAV